MNAAAGEELGIAETQNNNRGCNKVARKWWVELRWRLLNMTRRTTSWIFRKPRSFCVLARFVAVLSKLTQCCDEDAGVFGYQQLHLEMFFCLDSRPESRVRKQKQVCKLRRVSRGQEKDTQIQRTTEATPTSRLDEGRWKELRCTVCQAWCRDRDSETDSHMKEGRKGGEMVTRDEVQARRPRRMITLQSLVTCGVVSPPGLSPVFIPQPSFF